MAIISELRCVDKVIPCHTLDKTQVVKDFNINKIFIGDDWFGNSRWEKTKNDMAKLGVDVIFIPHTDGISSSILREKIIDY
jgi:glycerol-3-phosphate cytidylyltransferase